MYNNGRRCYEQGDGNIEQLTIRHYTCKEYRHNVDTVVILVYYYDVFYLEKKNDDLHTPFKYSLM